jgi:hypothetical protein
VRADDGNARDGPRRVFAAKHEDYFYSKVFSMLAVVVF